MLHNDRDLFEAVVLSAAEQFEIDPVIIEKDYYVTLFLKEIVKRQPKIIFKGGTSLSKCYHLINRFSEDIDLNIESDKKPTEGQRKNLTATILSVIEDFGFVLKNPEKIGSRRDYNRYEVDVDSLFSSEYLKHDLIVETAVFLRAYPSVKMQASSFVYEYLKAAGRDDIVAMCGLEPFELQVQAVERTFIDKLFALCDYYLQDKVSEHSRHLYDIYKMSSIVIIDQKLKELFNAVKEEQKIKKICPSAAEEICFKDCITEVIKQDVYKKDYEQITQSFIFEKTDYETVSANLQKIIDSGLFE
ncbi:MAG: nucleotidyl transferase AbiEii/AbiGii toxin family protein [Clostridia bacterium]|nr:nucleotidyl transferase AbiEii/AbiGii toxin family protein [Clostridia bacterium]